MQDEGLIKRSTTRIKQPTLEMPEGMSNDHYSEQISKCVPGRKEYFVWLAFSKYAKAVREFYCSIMLYFNITIDVSEKITLSHGIISLSQCSAVRTPEENMEKLTELAQKLENAENNLKETLRRNNTSMNARCNSDNQIKELRESALTAWVVYHNLKQNNQGDELDFYTIIDFKRKHADTDMQQDRNIALISADHYRTKYFVQTKVNGLLKVTDMMYGGPEFKRAHPKSYELYIGQDAHKAYSGFIRLYNGYVYEDNEQELEQLQQQVTDKRALEVIHFYKTYYNDVKHVYKHLFYWGNYHKNHPHENYTILHDRFNIKPLSERNLYEAAKEYVDLLKEIKERCECEEYLFFVQDLDFLISRLNEAIEATKAIYKETPKEIKKIIESEV